VKNNIRLGGSCIELSDYMNSLTQEDIDSLPRDSTTKIVAAGVNKQGEVILVTQTADVYTFRPNVYHIPPGDFAPCASGKQVFMPNEAGRWPGESQGFYVDSQWLIDRSNPSLSRARLYVGDTYLGEIDTGTAEATDT